MRIDLGFTGTSGSLLVRKRQFDGEDHSISRLGMYFTNAAQVSHTLFDPEQTKTLELLHVKTMTVILNRKRDRTRFLLNPNPYGGCLGMTGAIM